MKRKFLLIITTSILICYLVASLTFSQQNYSKKEAEKVLDLIKKIQLEKSASRFNKFQKIKVTESEFNSYIAYRIETEKEEIMKELQLKFFNENTIEGKIFIDLGGQDLPRYLRPEMTFYFSAEVEVQNSAVRLNIQKLFLENQEIQPVVLDMLILFASKIGNWDSGSINDWYELPYGIKDIRTFEGHAEFYY